MEKLRVEMPGIEPGAFHMQSERSTAELHPHTWLPPAYIFGNIWSPANFNQYLFLKVHYTK